MTIFDEYKTYTGDSSISPSIICVKNILKMPLILSALQRKYGAGGYRQPYFFMSIFENFATEER